MAFKSSYRDIILPIPKDWVHDAWIALLFGIFSKIVPISDPLIYYRIHSEQQIGAAINQTLRDEISAAKKVTNEIYSKVQNNYEEIQKLISSYPSLIKNKNSVVKAINGKISHYQDRIEIHEMDFKIKRLPLILLNTLNGRYFRYSSGLKSILKDLLLDWVVIKSENIFKVKNKGVDIMSILVTGVAGFIGSNFGRRLLDGQTRYFCSNVYL